VASTDAAGNTAEATLDFVLDTIAPAVVLGLVNDTGVSSTDGITRDGRAVVSSSDGNLSLTLDGSVVTRDNSENISATGDGSHRLQAVATDRAGNTSTATLDFVLDTIAPALVLELVADTGISATDHLTRDGRVSVSSSEGNVHTTIDGITVTRDSLGRVSAARDGSHLIAATATDAAGNSTSATLDFVLDSSSVAVESTRMVRSKRGVTEVVVTFNKRLDATTVNHLENYKISLPGRRPKQLSIASVSFDGARTITLRLQKPARTNGDLLVTYAGATIADLAGNRLI
jgi:hypothetical protein